MESREDFKEYLKNSDCETTIIKFGATWCKPCQTVAPILKKLNEEYKNKKYNYLDLDVDKCSDLYSFLKQKKMVNGIPVVLFYKKCNYDENHYYVPSGGVTGASNDIVKLYKKFLS
uniref:Thioredoxin domain-containing protein n=1 Tax=viral metagenome TaxID=1070528 RepID=A0A6C0EUZ8_9ZZZZ